MNMPPPESAHTVTEKVGERVHAWDMSRLTTPELHTLELLACRAGAIDATVAELYGDLNAEERAR
jgi:hypothetical protein